MSKARVTVTISPMSDVKFDVQGAVGTECTDITKNLERAVGAGDGDTTRTLKPEFRATGQAGQKNTASW